MGLVDELRTKSNKLSDARQEVIKEIKEYFDEYFVSDEFEDNLRRLLRADDIAKRKMCVLIWFSSDFKDTNFYCGGESWKTPESSEYKGIYLSDIRNDVCEYLESKLIQRMNDFGFNYIEKKYREKEDCDWWRWNCPHYYFGW